MSHHHPFEAERSLARHHQTTEGVAADAADTSTPAHPLLALQRKVGNAQVARMLAQREAAEEEEIQAKHDTVQREGEEEDEIQAKHDTVQREGEEEDEIQAKHDTVQREGEEEDEIQAKHDTLQREGEEEDEIQAKHDTVQREGEEEDEIQAKHDTLQREGEAVQPEVGLAGGPVSAELSGRINSKRGGGASLDAGTRTSMEGAFGTSFADVRIHHDTESDALNRSISAKAFTTGSDIFFRKDASPSDQGLLAHELTHVVQQRSGAVGGGGGMNVGAAGDSHEQEADAVAAQVTSGSAAQAQREAEQQAVQRAQLQREEAAEDEEQMA